MSSDILTEFRGRGDEIRVYPLSFAEYVTGYDGTEEDAFNDYMVFGGLPRILSFTTDEQKSKYLTNFFRETYFKDIIERNKVSSWKLILLPIKEIINIIYSLLFLFQMNQNEFRKNVLC